MFGKFNKLAEAKPTRIDTLIGHGTIIQGDVLFSGGLRVEGEIRGDVKLAEPEVNGTLMVGKNAVLHGLVDVTHLVVDGEIIGKIHASDSVELRATAKITGDIVYGRLEMQLGAIIEGQLANQQPATDFPAEKVNYTDPVINNH